MLIGGSLESTTAEDIIGATKHNKIYNFCKNTTIKQSAYLIKYSKLLLTNDTGIMHIASSFDLPIISFWGCTKPSLGFYAYKPHAKSINIISNISEKPCIKI